MPVDSKDGSVAEVCPAITEMKQVELLNQSHAAIQLVARQLTHKLKALKKTFSHVGFKIHCNIH